MLKNNNLMMILMLVLSGYVFSCSSKQKNNINPDTTKKVIDTIWFSYNLFADTQIVSKIFDTPIILDSLHDDADYNVFKRISKQENYKANKSMSIFNEEYKDISMMTITNAGKFSFNSNTYYYLFYENFFYNCNPCVVYLSLYKLDSEGKLTRIPIGYQASNNSMCFGDFNNDGSLDYANWDFSDEVSFYSLNGNKFQRNKTFNIKLKSSEFNKYYVEPTKSNWPNKKW